MEETESDGEGERRGAGKCFVLGSTILDAERMEGTKAKSDGGASPGLGEPFWCWGYLRGLGVPGELTETWGDPWFITIPARTIPGISSILRFPNCAPALSQR